MATLAEAYGIELTPERVKIYLMALEGQMTAEELNQACQMALERTRFFPTVAEILSQKITEEKGVDQLVAEQAWDTLQAHIARWGSDGVPVFSGGKIIKPPPLDPATEWATRQTGGLQQVAHLNSTNFPFVRRDFISFYKRFQETAGLQLTPGKAEATRMLEKYAPALLEK